MVHPTPTLRSRTPLHRPPQQQAQSASEACSVCESHRRSALDCSENRPLVVTAHRSGPSSSLTGITMSGGPSSLMNAPRRVLISGHIPQDINTGPSHCIATLLKMDKRVSKLCSHKYNNLSSFTDLTCYLGICHRLSASRLIIVRLNM